MRESIYKVLHYWLCLTKEEGTIRAMANEVAEILQSETATQAAQIEALTKALRNARSWVRFYKDDSAVACMAEIDAALAAVGEKHD